jgi:hypothetical protein
VDGCVDVGGMVVDKPLGDTCDTCDTFRSHPAPAPLDRWSGDDARALIRHVVSRVDWAWHALDDQQRAELAALQAHLGGAGPTPIEAARRARDMMGLRRALAAYELEATPLFAAARLARKVRT